MSYVDAKKFKRIISEYAYRFSKSWSQHKLLKYTYIIFKIQILFLKNNREKETN